MTRAQLVRISAQMTIVAAGFEHTTHSSFAEPDRRRCSGVETARTGGDIGPLEPYDWLREVGSFPFVSHGCGNGVHLETYRVDAFGADLPAVVSVGIGEQLIQGYVL